MRKVKKILVTVICVALLAAAGVCAFIAYQIQAVIEHDIPYGHSQVSEMVFDYEAPLISEPVNDGWGYRMFLSATEAEQLFSTATGTEITLQLHDSAGTVMQLPDHRPMEIRLLRSTLEQMVLESRRSTGSAAISGRMMTFNWQPSQFYNSNQSDNDTVYEMHLRSLLAYDLQSRLMTQLGCSRHTTTQLLAFGYYGSIILLLIVAAFSMSLLLHDIDIPKRRRELHF